MTTKRKAILTIFRNLKVYQDLGKAIKIMMMKIAFRSLFIKMKNLSLKR